MSALYTNTGKYDLVKNSLAHIPEPYADEFIEFLYPMPSENQIWFWNDRDDGDDVKSMLAALTTLHPISEMSSPGYGGVSSNSPFLC